MSKRDHALPTCQDGVVVSDGNRTERSPIRSVIIYEC